MEPHVSAKSERIDLRVSPTIKRLLQEAAAAAHQTVTEFLVHSGITLAEETLADRRVFSLNSEKWEEFVAALDAPPQDNPRLRKLLAEPSVFER